MALSGRPRFFRQEDFYETNYDSEVDEREDFYEIQMDEKEDATRSTRVSKQSRMALRAHDREMKGKKK